MKTTSLAKFFSSCAIAAMIAALAGCYTVIKHPHFETENGEATSAAPITYADDCSSCHESNGYVAAHGYGAPPARSYDRWYYYYEYPWWIPYYAPDNGGGRHGDREQQQRPLGRRHRGENENNQPAQTATAATGSDAAANPSIISTSGSETKKEEPKPADKRGDRGGSEDKGNRRERKP